MYEKPKIERLGTFRELTQWGSGGSAGDTGAVFGMAYSESCGVNNSSGCRS